MSGNDNRRKRRTHLEDDDDLQTEDGSFVQMYNKFCRGCIKKFRNVIISKLESSPKHAPFHNDIIDNAVVQYLKNNSLSIVERIEEEFNDNKSCENNEFRDNLLGCIPLRSTLSVLEVLKNKDILNLTNLSDHVLLKGSLKGVVMEIDDPHRSKKDIEENSPMTFDEALLKCIPRDMSCTCNNDSSRQSYEIIDSYDKDDKVDYCNVEHANNESRDNTDDNNDGDDDKSNSIDIKKTLMRNAKNNTVVYPEIPNYRKCNNTIKLIGNNEKYLCLEICKHKKNCPVDINNIHVISRNIDLRVKKSNSLDTDVELDITDFSDSSVNTGNMVYISGSTVYRGEIFMKKDEEMSEIQRTHNKDTLEGLFMLMNKNENLTQTSISNLVNELDRAKRIMQSFTICNLTYVAPMVCKLFKDQIMKEFNNAYGRSVTTLHLGPLSRGNIYDETKIWMRERMQRVMEKNIEINCGNLQQSTILFDVPLCGNKTTHGTHVSLSSLCGKNTLLTNIRVVLRLITIIDFIASDIHDIVYNRELLKSNTKLQATDPINLNSQASASSSSSSSSSSSITSTATNINTDTTNTNTNTASIATINTTTTNNNNINDVNDVRYKMLVKDYSLCLHIKKALQDTHRYLKAIYMETI
uniref:Uncharacterized protein n=1 Tax=Penaeus monodon majanivirus B TaxID=2984272 RepID=A0A9C7C7N8_9VIRU|nr:MAG: hypothetical protein [Penaeus monodon majanivirus B]